MRVTDVVMAFPSLILAIGLIAVFEEPGLDKVALVLVVLGWTTIARVVRGEVLSLKERDYVQAARALGVGHTPDAAPPSAPERGRPGHRRRHHRRRKQHDRRGRPLLPRAWAPRPPPSPGAACSPRARPSSSPPPGSPSSPAPPSCPTDRAPQMRRGALPPARGARGHGRGLAVADQGPLRARQRGADEQADRRHLPRLQPRHPNRERQAAEARPEKLLGRGRPSLDHRLGKDPRGEDQRRPRQSNAVGHHRPRTASRPRNSPPIMAPTTSRSASTPDI